MIWAHWVKGELHLGEIWRLGWDRFNVISGVVGDINGRAIALLFYFTILVPFGIISRLFTDPLNQRVATNAKTFWQDRAPIPTDLDSAKRQG
jgi:hypothetical protein